MNCKAKTYVAMVTGATAVARVIQEMHNKRPVVRRFSASGNDAASAVAWYIPRKARSFGLVETLAANQTLVKVPVDVVGGHVFKGKTLTTSFLLLLPYGTDGWTLVTASAVNNVADAAYCTMTITATGAAIPKGCVAYILAPTEDVVSALPAIGNASVTLEYVMAGELSAPLVFTVVSAEAKTCAASCYVEWQD